MAGDPLIGRQLANFKVERVLGHGGMAQVYYGHDVALQRPVAIKVIDARFRDDPTYAERFVREARTVATWRHENILQVYYADEEEGLFYFVMEYIDGLDLGQLLTHYTRDGELMPHNDVLQIGRAVASALDYAHERGVIHRDVKPSNVMIASDDRVVLADFGLAMNLQQGSLGEIFGTPHYIAPEQARRSADATPQSDLYSLGVMLYEMLTGLVPFDDPSPASLALQHLTMPPPPPREINPALNAQTEHVLLKALSKDPAARYQSGRVLIDALDAAIHAAPPIDLAELPPPPAEAMQSRLSLSQLSVAERVTRHISASPTPVAFRSDLIAATRRPQDSPPPSTTMRAKTPRRSKGWLIGGAGFGALVIIAAILFLILTNGDDDQPRTDAASTPTEIPAEQAAGANLPTATFTLEATVIEQPSPTDTERPLPTETNTLPPTEASTDTPVANEPIVIPTETTQPSSPPTATAPPTVSAPTLSPTEALAPTVLYPAGRRFVLYYDENTLFVRNFSADRVEVRPFTFERLDTSGNPLNRVEGSRWSQFYAFIHAQGCIKIIILNSPAYLPPPSCQIVNSEVWAENGLSLDFWTPQDNSTQFRVLWNGEEVARCEINASECEVFIP